MYECPVCVHMCEWKCMCVCVHVANDCSPPPFQTYQMGKSAAVFLPGPQWPTCVALSPSCQGPRGPHPAFIRSPEHRMEGGRRADGRIDWVDPDPCDVMMSWPQLHNWAVSKMVCDEVGMCVEVQEVTNLSSYQ